ncbi:hypothetical protein CCR75_000516 [Bremia lactucae]|uniref:Uncharacterized protein n=1 Tax=Bremia lactucae TaxID=4779 RepID=A0A976IJL7_BRELC|nr:hypothetical protein CCR75_000516 [Bremia lactucae]
MSAIPTPCQQVIRSPVWTYFIPLTAFLTSDGLFEYLVTPMGLSGSPGVFNCLLQCVFSNLRDVMRI